MIAAEIWTLLSALALAFNIWGLRDAYCDLVLLRRIVGNGPRARRMLVATAHVREEALGVMAQTAFLTAGVLRIWLGPPRTDRADLYRLITSVLFLLVQTGFVANSIARRRYRHRVVSEKERMLAAEEAARPAE